MVNPARFFNIGLALVTALTVSAAPAVAGTKIEHVVSDGGIEAYLISEPSIPFMSLSLRFDGGANTDPDGIEGLARLTSSLLDEGAGDMDSQAFQTELEDLAIHMTPAVGREYFSIDLKTLTDHRDRAFDMLRLALTAPRFDDEPVERIKSQLQASLRRRQDDPDRMASETWLYKAFPDHVHAKPIDGTVQSIDAITGTDLQEFVDQRFARDNLIIGVAGDITADELGPLLDQTFGDLPSASKPINPPEVTPQEHGINVVRLDVPQSSIVFGQKGIKRDDPDFFAAFVANHILGGGGFTSRLTKEIREDRGLAYSVYSYLAPSDVNPTWKGGLGTSNASVIEALDLVRQEVKRMAEGDVSEQELEDAKTYLTGSFPLRLTSNDRIAGLLVTLQVHDLGLDYLDKRSSLIETVTLDDVKRVAARLYDPDKLLTVVVGDPPDLEG